MLASEIELVTLVPNDLFELSDVELESVAGGPEQTNDPGQG